MSTDEWPKLADGSPDTEKIGMILKGEDQGFTTKAEALAEIRRVGLPEYQYGVVVRKDQTYAVVRVDLLR